LKLSINEVFNTFKDQPWVRSRSGLILYCQNRRSTAPTTTAKGTKLSTAGPSGDTWRNLSNKASSRSTFSLPRRSLCNQTHSLPGSRARSPSTRRSTYFPTFMQTEYTLLNLSFMYCIHENKITTQCFIFCRATIQSCASMMGFLPLGGCQ